MKIIALYIDQSALQSKERDEDDSCDDAGEAESDLRCGASDRGWGSRDARVATRCWNCHGGEGSLRSRDCLSTTCGIGGRSWGTCNQSDSACRASDGADNHLRYHDGSGNNRSRGAGWDDSSRLAARNHDCALNSDGGNRAAGIVGRTRDIRGAREKGRVGANLVDANALEVVLSVRDVAWACTMSVETVVDRAHKGLGGTVAVSSGIRRAVGVHRNPGVQALRKDAWA